MGSVLSLSGEGIPALKQPTTSSSVLEKDLESPPPSSSSSSPILIPHRDPTSHDEDPNSLIIQAWAYCKAKPAPMKYRSPAEEAKRKESQQWRGRQSFVELDCGEDSFFIAKHSLAIGIADGVGGWRSRGVDPSEFSNALMKHAKAFTDNNFGKNGTPALDPQRIIAVAHKKVVDEKKVRAGSSTACVATLVKNADGTHELDVANLGDSGLLVVRNQKQIFRAKENIHAFNTPYQLAVLPPEQRRRSLSDSAADCTRERLKVEEGDVIVMGTDGLFDNRFGTHLAADAGWLNVGGSSSGAKTSTSAFLSTIPVLGSWLSVAMGGQTVAFTDPYRVVRRLVMDASTNSLSKTAVTPWSTLLREEGVAGALGGKSDDITVVLGRISRRGGERL